MKNLTKLTKREENFIKKTGFTHEVFESGDYDKTNKAPYYIDSFAEAENIAREDFKINLMMLLNKLYGDDIFGITSLNDIKDKNDNSTLKPCPFCGSTKLDISIKVTQHRGDRKYRVCVYCKKCNSYGPRVLVPVKGDSNRKDIENNEEAKAKAIEAWNDRSNNVKNRMDIPDIVTEAVPPFIPTQTKEDPCEKCPNRFGPRDVLGNPIVGDSPCQWCPHYKWKIT